MDTIKCDISEKNEYKSTEKFTNTILFTYTNFIKRHRFGWIIHSFLNATSATLNCITIDLGPIQPQSSYFVILINLLMAHLKIH